MSARASDPTAPRPPVTPSLRRPWGLALTLVVVAGAAAGVLPDLLGLDGRTPFAQLAAFRPVLLGGLLAGTVVVGIIARVRRRGAVLAVGLAAVTAVGVAVVAPRAIAALDVPKPDAPPARTLIVLAFNTYEGEADVDAVAEIIRTERPDLVALIETAGRYRDRIAPLLAPLGYRLHTAREQGRDVQSVTAAVHADLGDLAVTVDETTPFPSVEVTGGTLGTSGSSPSTPSPPPRARSPSGTAISPRCRAGAQTGRPARPSSLATSTPPWTTRRSARPWAPASTPPSEPVRGW